MGVSRRQRRAYKRKVIKEAESASLTVIAQGGIQPGDVLMIGNELRKVLDVTTGNKLFVTSLTRFERFKYKLQGVIEWLRIHLRIL